MARPLISIDDAREIVLQSISPLESETIPIDDALDRVLAQDVTCTSDVPPFPSSAMDGYAVLAGPAGRALEVIGESRAGSPTDQVVSDGVAIRISTGGAVPDGASAVIRQEDVELHDRTIALSEAVTNGENIRRAGEDMLAGTTVLRKGTRLGAADLGAAVAAGAGELVVARRPHVHVLCTGDELRAPGEPLGPGEIHNSNAPMLVALARRHGATAPHAKRLPDDRTATEIGLELALAQADVVIISGGVSVGPHDHVKPALEALGVNERFWGVSLQPGKPTWFGARDETLVFGLPGNPVSAAVTFSLFARPALDALQGAETTNGTLPPHATLGAAVRQNRQREQAVRVRLERDGDKTFAFPNGPQGSHIITSLVGADALARIPPGPGELEAGTTVALEPLPH